MSAAFALVCLALAACIIQHEVPPLRGAWGTANSNTGSFTGSAIGYSGGEVGVYIRLAQGVIVEVRIDVSTQTPVYMRLDNLPQALESRVRETNTFDFSPDAFTSATTVRAARDAGRQALLQVPGVPPNYFD